MRMSSCWIRTTNMRKAFGDLAEIVNVDNLQLPFWLLDFEEAVGVLVRGGTAQEQEAQAIILKDAIIGARRRFAAEDLAAASVTVDTPVPYKASDLLRLIDDAMGKLDNPDSSAPYLRLRTRLDSLRYDRRFAFMFSDWLATRDTLAQIVGRLLRIPVDDKPLTIIDLSGIPAEIADVVVAMLCRLTFDFALWSERERMPPVLLVCEEAHRYVPASPGVGFAAASRAITRLAREGRKYGIFSRPDNAAAFGAVVSGAVAMRHRFRLAPGALPRSALYGDGVAGCCARNDGCAAEHANPGGDRIRRRRAVADAHSL